MLSQILNVTHIVDSVEEELFTSPSESPEGSDEEIVPSSSPLEPPCGGKCITLYIISQDNIWSE